MVPSDVIFKCLSDNERLRIVLLLRQQRDLNVEDISNALLLSKKRVEKHLNQITGCRIGLQRTWQYCQHFSIHPELERWVEATLDALHEAYPELIEADTIRLREFSERQQ